MKHANKVMYVFFLTFVLTMGLFNSRIFAAEPTVDGKPASSAISETPPRATLPLQAPQSSYRYQTQQLPAELQVRIHTLIIIFISYATVLIFRIPLLLLTAINRIIWNLRRRHLT